MLCRISFSTTKTHNPSFSLIPRYSNNHSSLQSDSRIYSLYLTWNTLSMSIMIQITLNSTPSHQIRCSLNHISKKIPSQLQLIYLDLRPYSQHTCKDTWTHTDLSSHRNLNQLHQTLYPCLYFLILSSNMSPISSPCQNLHLPLDNYCFVYSVPYFSKQIQFTSPQITYSMVPPFFLASKSFSQTNNTQLPQSIQELSGTVVTPHRVSLESLNNNPSHQ